MDRKKNRPTLNIQVVDPHLLTSLYMQYGSFGSHLQGGQSLTESFSSILHWHLYEMELRLSVSNRSSSAQTLTQTSDIGPHYPPV